MELWEILNTEHGLLTAPRRTGKTSVMDHLVAFPKNEFSPIPVFVQDLDHPAELILTLLDSFHDRHSGLFEKSFAASSRLFGKAFGKVKEFGAGEFKIALRESDPDWQKNWKKNGDDFLGLARKKGGRLLFIVDEFPDFVINVHEHHPDLVRPFLGWFRGHRLNPHPKADPVRWLLGGSVNLSSTLDGMGCLDEINDLHDEALPVLTEEQVVEFVRRMLEGRSVEMAKTLPTAVARRLGRPVPVFLQMIVQDLYRIWKRQPHKLTSADVDRAFDDLIVNSGARDKLQHYYSRIAQYYEEPKRSAAYEILSILSLSDDGLNRDALLGEFERILHEIGKEVARHESRRIFNQLLRDLENDFYVSETGSDRYDFASGLIKAWWRKYYAA